jgi:hypothetical protein
MTRRGDSITPLSRRNIFDYLSMEKIAWAGRLDEPDFLGRIWDLSDMPSYDRRYSDAGGDIHQHRVNNWDWDEDWVFSDARFNLLGCADDRFLEFLAQMVHPVVRPSAEDSAKLVEELNRHLRPDGFALVETARISGRIVYGGVRITATPDPASAVHLAERTLLENPAVLRDHLDRIRRTISSDPPAAIAAAKKLVESTLKVILDETCVEYANGEDLPKLYKKVSAELKLNKESVPESAKGSAAAQRILNTLTATVFNLSEMRNQLGLGHGRTAPSPALERHARLAFNAAVTLVEFLLDTWHARQDAAELSIRKPTQAAALQQRGRREARPSARPR